jgi:AraC-like DNA-binding protein
MVFLLRIERYPVVHPMLKTLAKYFWVLESDAPVIIDKALLPVCNIDLIFNLSGPITYIMEGKPVVSGRFHFNGILKAPCGVVQTGAIRVFGISLTSIGAFPILKSPLHDFAGQTVDLSAAMKGFTQKAADILDDPAAGGRIPARMESELVRQVDTALIPSGRKLELLKRFFLEAGQTGVGSFCERYGVNQRTLERITRQYTGASPKQCQRISRFHAALKDLFERGDEDLTDIAYGHAYFDQPHFIKDFKGLAGCAPGTFLKRQHSILQIIRG